MRLKGGAKWSVPVPGLFFLALVVGLGCFILVGPYAKAPPDLLSQIFTGRAPVRCRETGRDIAYTKGGINGSSLAAGGILGGDGKMMASGAKQGPGAHSQRSAYCGFIEEMCWVLTFKIVDVGQWWRYRRMGWPRSGATCPPILAVSAVPPIPCAWPSQRSLRVTPTSASS